MELQIAAALKQVGEPFSFALTEPLPPQQFGGRAVVCAAPLSVTGQYVFDGKGISVEGTVKTCLQSVCARCAETFEEPLEFGFSERFCKPAEIEEDSEAYPFEGDRLSLDQAVLDNPFLHLPLTSVCRPDCRGLCPICGTNRNLTPCDCEPARPISAWSALDAIRNED